MQRVYDKNDIRFYFKVVRKYIRYKHYEDYYRSIGKPINPLRQTDNRDCPDCHQPFVCDGDGYVCTVCGLCSTPLIVENKYSKQHYINFGIPYKRRNHLNKCLNKHHLGYFVSIIRKLVFIVLYY